MEIWTCRLHLRNNMARDRDSVLETKKMDLFSSEIILPCCDCNVGKEAETGRAARLRMMACGRVLITLTEVILGELPGLFGSTSSLNSERKVASDSLPDWLSKARTISVMANQLRQGWDASKEELGLNKFPCAFHVLCGTGNLQTSLSPHTLIT